MVLGLVVALAAMLTDAEDLAVRYLLDAYHNVHVPSIITWQFLRDSMQNVAASLCLLQKTVTNFQTGPDKAHINMYLRCQQLVRNLIQVFLGLITGVLVSGAAVMKTKVALHTFRQDIQDQQAHHVRALEIKDAVVVMV